GWGLLLGPPSRFIEAMEALPPLACRVRVSAAASQPRKTSPNPGRGEPGPSRERPRQAALGKPAFDQIYTEWFAEVSRWARAFGGLDADLDDLVQAGFLVGRRKLEGFDGENLPGWLYRIGQRTVGDCRRRAWFRRFFQPRRQVLEEVVDPAPSPEDRAESRDAQRVL